MKKAAISLMAWVAALQMNAVPANPKPFTYTQPDGTSVVLTLVGDEFSHTYIDGQGRAVDIYAGFGEADGGDKNTVWPHMWNLQAS